jgi:quercetin dioxygenase-like cupin family protein
LNFVTPNVQAEPKLQWPNLDNSFAYMGGVLSFLVSASETEGGLTILRFVSRHGNEPPPHVHSNEHEVMQVHDGEIEFFVEGSRESVVAKAGHTVHLPRGRAHGLVFRTPEVCATTVLHAMGGARTSEDALKAIASGPATSMDLPREAPNYGSVDREQLKRIAELAAAAGVTFLSPEQAAKLLPGYPGKH